jgi:Xaa-Pro aminopeptidase
MIQNFETRGGPEYGRKNLPKLRDTLKKLKLDGFLVPHEDEYQNEYLPDCNERLMWVSGFTWLSWSCHNNAGFSSYIC